MSDEITPEFLDVTALRIERGELKVGAKIARRFRQAADVLRNRETRERAYEAEVTRLREQLAAALAGKDGT